MSWKIPHSLFFISLLFGGGPAIAAEAPKWQAEWQKTIEAAKKEGQISLYGGQEITHPEIIAAFQQRVSVHQSSHYQRTRRRSPRAHYLGTAGGQIFSGRHRHRPQRAAHALFGQSVGPHRASAYSPGGHGRVQVVRWKALVRGSRKPVHFHVRRDHEQHEPFLQYEAHECR